ncbi:hypothetical protein [Wolbachia endosymbiont of Pentidionis agamae]|uniref:hypothetical protein n=1 Tax=Wolbachia endosymbiont of Pentidionis agamae TaxID=3110435 RepID=UPI002FD3ADAE
MWSFVCKKAMDLAGNGHSNQTNSWIGNRGAEGATKLLESMPEAYRRNSEFIADKFDAYTAIFPGILQVDKGSGLY